MKNSEGTSTKPEVGMRFWWKEHPVVLYEVIAVVGERVVYGYAPWDDGDSTAMYWTDTIGSWMTLTVVEIPGPARCTRCGTPNEYQPGPFLCYGCRS